MSGIAGVWRRDGSQVAETGLDRLERGLRPRGPAGATRWCRGAVGLCHRSLRSNPERPAQSAGRSRGNVIVTADVRLDNRADLVRTLSVDGDTSDGELIRAAYESWGVRCPAHLVGAFAFGVWDAGARRLFVARDHLGVKPLAYAATDEAFVFASEPGAVRRHSCVPDGLDDLWVAGFLVDDYADASRTVFDAVRRLPPGHSLVVDTDGVEKRRYWRLTPDPARVPSSHSARVARFRELFRTAVACRLPGTAPCGVLLSGGLDSSSITCTASALRSGPIRTFSATVDSFPEADERGYVDVVLDHTGADPHFVPVEGIGPLADRAQIFGRHGMPVRAANQFLTRELYRKAGETGTRVVLHGLHGDTVVSKGLHRLSLLARRGAIGTLAREIDGLARRTDHGPRRRLVRRALAPYAPGPVRRAWRTVVGRGGIDGDRAAMLASDLRRRVGMERLDDATASAPPADRHLNRLRSGLVPKAIEDTERTAATFGVEPRFPFLDKRLVEYCVSLPAAAKLRRGWSRAVLREAMADVLPRSVRRRGDKGDYSGLTVAALRDHEATRLDRLEAGDCPRLEGWVDPTELRRRCAEFRTDGAHSRAVWTALSLREWLATRDEHPRDDGSPHEWS